MNDDVLWAEVQPVGAHIILEGFGVWESDMEPVNLFLSLSFDNMPLFGIVNEYLSPLPEDFPECLAYFTVAKDEVHHLNISCPSLRMISKRACSASPRE